MSKIDQANLSLTNDDQGEAPEFLELPPTPGERLGYEIEVEKARRQHELSKYTAQELREELENRDYCDLCDAEPMTVNCNNSRCQDL